MSARAWLATLALVAGCGGSAAPEATFAETPLTTVDGRAGKLTVAVFTAPEQPPSRGTVTARLRVTERGKGTPVDGLVFEVVPEMPSMGHGTPVVPKTTAQGSGTYLVEDLDLFMAGRWDLLMTITGAVTDDVVVSIDVR